MKKLITKLLISLLSSCCLLFSAHVLAADFAAVNGLRVELAAPAIASKSVAEDSDLNITIRFINTSGLPIYLPMTMLPQSASGPLFKVTRDGQKVKYRGILVKRGPITKEEMIVLLPGKQIVQEIELSALYKIDEPGNYSVEYNVTTRNMSTRSMAEALSETDSTIATTKSINAVEFTFQGTKIKASEDTTNANQVSNYANTFKNCSNKQKTQLNNAKNSAWTSATNASSHIRGLGNSLSNRYITWFGNSSFVDTTAADAYNKTAANLNAIQFNCNCRGNYYAYVYPDDPYKIYVCKAFWDAPLVGRDSKAGTIIHEMTHFYVVRGTEDYAYGHAESKRLAKTDPSAALYNADSFEYFAENTP